MELWEILVPASWGKQQFSYEHHKAWDDYVISIAGGLTVFRGAKGQWISPDGKLFYDRIIPCRVACTREQLELIIDFTAKHYQQLAIMAYRVSDYVIIKHTEE